MSIGPFVATQPRMRAHSLSGSRRVSRIRNNGPATTSSGSRSLVRTSDFAGRRVISRKPGPFVDLEDAHASESCGGVRVLALPERRTFRSASRRPKRTESNQACASVPARITASRALTRGPTLDTSNLKFPAKARWPHTRETRCCAIRKTGTIV